MPQELEEPPELQVLEEDKDQPEMPVNPVCLARKVTPDQVD